MASQFPPAVPEMPVSHLRNAVRHYVDVLGFTFDWGEDDGIAGVSQGDCRLFLTDAPFRGGRGPESPIVVWLNVTSRQEVDELCARWTGAGATIVEAVNDKPWKLREFTAADPDGNRLRVFYDFSRD